MIDLVIPWVDGNDKKWKSEMIKYSGYASDSVRFQSWDNLQYIFRGIEKHMPWIDRVFLVTVGHLPKWLNTNCPKLKIIKHEDYIPAEYLPTFNSNTIEMNYWRINELSEKFILFNDDLFILKDIPEEYYFHNDLPCEEAVETHFILKADKGLDLQMNYACVNNMVIINRNFDKREVIERNREKWFSPVYGERLNQNFNLEFWNSFESFVYPHEAMPMKKSVLQEIWEKEPEMLDIGSRNKFRSYSDVTQRVITMWQICTGDFEPCKYEGKLYILDESNVMDAVSSIRSREYPIISLNESTNADFDYLKGIINPELEKLFPEKSSFEK